MSTVLLTITMATGIVRRYEGRTLTAVAEMNAPMTESILPALEQFRLYDTSHLIEWEE